MMTGIRRQPFELFDETLDINATDNYDLAVEISDSGLAYSVLDLLRSKYVLLRHYQNAGNEEENIMTLQDAISGDDFLRRHYRKVFLIIPSAKSTLVPDPLYDNTLKEAYYRFNLQTDGSEIIGSSHLPEPGATVVFSVDKYLKEITDDKWPGITPWHHLKTLLHHAHAAARTSDKHYIHLHIEKGFVTVIVLFEKNLLFCNTFVCSAPSDISYYFFNVLNNLNIRTDESVWLSGSIEPYSELHLSLLEFTHAVHFASPLVKYGFSYVFNDVNLHRYLNIFTASSCE